MTMKRIIMMLAAGDDDGDGNGNGDGTGPSDGDDDGDDDGMYSNAFVYL